MPFYKNCRNFEFEDIENFVNKGVKENKFLDYKQTINIDSIEEKKEFLYDISSFANTEGGLIIYGLSDKRDNKNASTGIPNKICGIIVDNDDSLILRIENIIRDGINPYIPNITIKILERDSIKILLIKIPKAIGLPRMVTYKKTNKYYKRNNAGKYLVDAYELNQMFIENNIKIDELNEFRKERLDKIVNKQINLKEINPSNITVLHIIPIHFFYNNTTFPISDNNFMEKYLLKINPLNGIFIGSRFTSEGFYVYSYNRVNNNIIDYNLFFNNGVVEIFSHRFHLENDEFNSIFLETSIIDKSKEITTDRLKF